MDEATLTALWEDLRDNYQTLLDDSQLSWDQFFQLLTLESVRAGGGGGGGSTSSTTITSGVDSASFNTTLTSIDSALAVPTAVKANATLSALNDGLVVDVSSFGGRIATVAFDYDVSGLGGSDSITFALEARTDSAAAFRSYDNNPSPFVVSTNGNGSAAMSWAVDAFRFRISAVTGTPTVVVRAKAVPGGSGI